MRSTADSTALSQLQELQGTTGEKQLASDDLLALRSFFLVLDEWDRNVKKKLHAIPLPIARRDVIQEQPDWPVERKRCAK
jgi:hypothetical protein